MRLRRRFVFQIVDGCTLTLMAKASKPKNGKSWKMKLQEDHPSHGSVVEIPLRMQNRLGEGTMLIPRPRDVDALVRKVRKGNVLRLSELREKLAGDAGADYACPLTTGIFLRIVAEAAEEARVEGAGRVTPYWRVVRDDGQLIDKFPGGVEAHAAKLRAEGIPVGVKGRSSKLRVLALN